MCYMREVTLVLVSIVLLCVMPLTGCHGQVSSTETPATSETEPSHTTASVTEQPSAKQGGILKLYGVDPMTLDPAVSGEMTSHAYVAQIFSGLVKLGDDLEPAPDIAEKWEVSADGCTYTFYLRRDVTFHDGRAVTAGDFKYSLERACDPATGSRTAGPYLGDIVGVQDVLAGKASEISGVRVIGDYTLEITIDAPRSYFLSKMTYPTACVVDKYNVERGGEWWRSPNGTGPFKLEQWLEEELLVLERNDNYYGDRANLDGVEFQLWSGVPMRMYETGDIDVTGVSVSYIDRVTDTAGPFHDQLQKVPELSYYYIGFNSTGPPFDDLNVRKAFAMAIDKEKIVSLVYRDLVQSADGILPPGIPGYNEDLDGLEFDPESARELIAASNYGDVASLPPITITTSGYGGSIPGYLSAVIQEWRDNLGVEVTVRVLEPERYIYHLIEEKDEMFDMGWVADYPHPQDFLEVLFYTGVENNFAEYSNPEIDALLDRAAVETDSELSLEMYRQIEQMLVDDAACLPLWFGMNYILVKPHVKGYELNPMGFAMLNKVWLDD
jgi:oligopeptide transport system substrate-binding protein